jgi:hypothetical protein
MTATRSTQRRCADARRNRRPARTSAVICRNAPPQQPGIPGMITSPAGRLRPRPVVRTSKPSRAATSVHAAPVAAVSAPAAATSVHAAPVAAVSAPAAATSVHAASHIGGRAGTRHPSRLPCRQARRSPHSSCGSNLATARCMDSPRPCGAWRAIRSFRLPSGPKRLPDPKRTFTAAREGLADEQPAGFCFWGCRLQRYRMPRCRRALTGRPPLSTIADD